MSFVLYFALGSVEKNKTRKGIDSNRGRGLKGYFYGREQGGGEWGRRANIRVPVTGWGSLIYLAVRDRNSIKNHLV